MAERRTVREPVVRGIKQRMKAWEQTQRDCERDGRQGGRENLLLVGGARQAVETFFWKGLLLHHVP